MSVDVLGDLLVVENGVVYGDIFFWIELLLFGRFISGVCVVLKDIMEVLYFNIFYGWIVDLIFGGFFVFYICGDFFGCRGEVRYEIVDEVCCVLEDDCFEFFCDSFVYDCLVGIFVVWFLVYLELFNVSWCLIVSVCYLVMDYVYYKNFCIYVFWEELE